MALGSFAECMGSAKMAVPGAGHAMLLRLILGGEGEVPNTINQQPEWREWSDPASQSGAPLRKALMGGEAFLFCSNLSLPFPDETVDEVVTNNVPIDRPTLWGPGIQSAEIWRVLRPGCEWIHDGTPIARPA